MKNIEKRDLYDINRVLTGKTIFKGDSIPDNNYIVVVLVFIQNSDGKFLIQKRSKINIGDQIEFSKLPDLQETILVDVLDLYRDNTFENLFKKLFDDDEEIKRKTSAMYQYYSHDEEKQYGIVGIKISLVK